MAPIKPHWKAHAVVPVGRGGHVQQVVATVGSAQFEIDD